ncbi:MAG: HPr kinase/phosphatase C-terminal domain-containing protein [Alphaproteobacteria bacterium]|jgi:serine kinase of HPr protein (carbohydrate metabolism regulator)|nr:HPr kinase/phosphatase C-terminal domain-containing protein [Alphaproteobacteria bacterium]
MKPTDNLHGTGLVLGTTGILLRGPSGAGKSVLALSLLDRWTARGLPALLVSDDRVDVMAQGDGLQMSAPEQLAGLIELRGRGIIRRPHCQTARLHLVIDLVPDMVRMLEEHEFATELAGVPLARAPVPYGSVISVAHQILLVAEAIAECDRP